jgi:hypothetical protein
MDEIEYFDYLKYSLKAFYSLKTIQDNVIIMNMQIELFFTLY